MRNDYITRLEVSDLISRQAAIDALHEWENVYTWDENCLEDREKVYAPSEVIEALPSAQQTLYGYNIEHLALIASALQKENLPPDRLAEILTDIGRIVTMVQDEFEESLRKAVEQCKMM